MNVFMIINKYLNLKQITKIAIAADGEIAYEIMTEDGPKSFYINQYAEHVSTVLPRVITVGNLKILKNGIINTYDIDGNLQFKGSIREYYEAHDIMEIQNIINSNQ